ncbi:hypothetical protein BU26DRAFT_388931, partial [Trematosphaeria pertusa]
AIDHIDDILLMGPRVCKGLTEFIFHYTDPDREKPMACHSLTADAVIRLAKACPNLKKVLLQGTCRLGDDVLLTFFKNCANLTFLEITGSHYTSGRALSELCEHDNWVPKLKKLRLDDDNIRKPFMKAMRDLTKQRQATVVELVRTSEYKKWGDFYLEMDHDSY